MTTLPSHPPRGPNPILPSELHSDTAVRTQAPLFPQPPGFSEQPPAPGPKCTKRDAENTLPRWNSASPATTTPAGTRSRQWLAEHPQPSGRQLAEAGYVAPHWAPPYGLDADPITQLLIDEELRRAGVRRPINPIGIGWAGPTLLYAGTAEQKERWLWALLSGEEFWCQLFSEPGAGSDLASLTHPGRARRRPLRRQRAEGVDQLRPHRPLGDLAGPDRSDGHQAPGHQLLRVPDGRSGDRDSAAHRHDRRARVQRGLLHRCAHPGRPSHRARARRVGSGQGDAGQRAGLAVG